MNWILCKQLQMKGLISFKGEVCHTRKAFTFMECLWSACSEVPLVSGLWISTFFQNQTRSLSWRQCPSHIQANRELRQPCGHRYKTFQIWALLPGLQQCLGNRHRNMQRRRVATHYLLEMSRKVNKSIELEKLIHGHSPMSNIFFFFQNHFGNRRKIQNLYFPYKCYHFALTDDNFSLSSSSSLTMTQCCWFLIVLQKTKTFISLPFHRIQ